MSVLLVEKWPDEIHAIVRRHIQVHSTEIKKGLEVISILVGLRV